MTNKRPQTIQFFLPQGEPCGIRIAARPHPVPPRARDVDAQPPQA